jgi:hypothetical protein
MPPLLPTPARPRLGALLATSWSVLRRHPVISAALGAAVVLSLASMIFGIGALVTPWFVCEVFAFQLAVLTGRPTRRSASWIRAGLLVLCLVGIVVAATWIAALALGPDVATADSAAGPLPWDEALARVLLIATVTALAVGFIAPFQYAPLVLIERGGTTGAAVLESAWLVRRGGLARHWALAFLAHLLPLAPALVAAVVVARTFERAATPVGVLLGLPLLPFSVPLGQGLLSAAYVRRREELPEPRWTRAEGRPPWPLVALLGVLVLAPMASVLLLLLGTLRPAPPAPGAVREGQLVLARRLDGAPVGAPVRLHVPDTTLEVAVDGRAVEVHGGDGGGTGRLAAPWTDPVRGVRVLRRRDFYAIELRAADGRWSIEVDRAAMRVDDTVGARLAARLPAWALPAIALAFGLSALFLVRPLARLGGVRRAYGAPAQRRPPLRELRAERRRALRRAWTTGLLLLLPALLALAGGALALWG